jgi:hypothetical protein
MTALLLHPLLRTDWLTLTVATLWGGLAGLAGFFLNEWLDRRKEASHRLPSPEIDSETTRAAVDLYAIRRRLDVAWLHSELRRESTRIRRLMVEELNDRR